MDLTLTKASLLAALNDIKPAAAARSVLPILSCVLIEAEGDSVRLTYSNRDLQLMRVIRPDHCAQGGTLAVDIAKLHGIVRALPEGTLRLHQANNGRLTLTAGRSRFTLASLPGEDFPLFGHATPTLRVRVTGPELRRGLGATRFAMAVQDVRYYLNGLLLEWDAEVFPGQESRDLWLVALDGHRLARAQIGAQIIPGQDEQGQVDSRHQVIIPRDAVNLLMALAGTQAELDLTFSARDLVIDYPEGQLQTKLVDGRYPEYQRVIPQVDLDPWRLEVAPLAAGLSRAMLLAHEEFKGLKLELPAGSEFEGFLRLQTANRVDEQALEEVPVELVSPPKEAVGVGLRGPYLADVLHACPSEVVEVFVRDSNSALRLRPVMDASAGPTRPVEWVIMPMLL